MEFGKRRPDLLLGCELPVLGIVEPAINAGELFFARVVFLVFPGIVPARLWILVHVGVVLFSVGCRRAAHDLGHLDPVHLKIHVKENAVGADPPPEASCPLEFDDIAGKWVICHFDESGRDVLLILPGKPSQTPFGVLLNDEFPFHAEDRRGSRIRRA